MYEAGYIFALQVPFELCSLDHGDVFILDTKNKIYQFNGENSSIHERGKAFEVIQHIKDEYHEGICDVSVIGQISSSLCLISVLYIYNLLLPSFQSFII